jgi:hypothetical protein
MKSWVVGIKLNGIEKAYDWNDLLKVYFIQDTIGRQPILLMLEKDTSSFHAFSRELNGQTLSFITYQELSQLIDSNTHSAWDQNGHCISGTLKEAQLKPVPAYQEFWHSWKQFHPNTTQFKP